MQAEKLNIIKQFIGEKVIICECIKGWMRQITNFDCNTTELKKKRKN